MKVEKFWNQAFLAALGRLPADEAKCEADLATDLCIKHWQTLKFHWAHPNIMRWKDQDIVDVPKGVVPEPASNEVSTDASSGVTPRL